MQNMNMDFIPKISSSIEILDDTVIKNLQKGSEGVVEMAEATGSAKFTTSANNFKGGVEELIKAGQELIEVLTNVKTQYAKLDSALNG